MTKQLDEALSKTMKALDEFYELSTLDQQVEFLKRHNRSERQPLLLFDVLSMIDENNVVKMEDGKLVIEVGEFRTSDGLSYIVFANSDSQDAIDKMITFLNYAKDYRVGYPSRQDIDELLENIQLGIRFLYVHETALSITSGTEYAITFDDLNCLIGADSDCSEDGLQWIQPEQFEY